MQQVRTFAPAAGVALLLAMLAGCGESGPKPPTAVAASSSTNQVGVVNLPAPSAPAVKVSDEDGTGVANVEVVFAVKGGGGVALGATATTNAEGIATVGGWQLGRSVGSNTITASVEGLTGSPVVFTATAGPGAPASVSVLIGNGQSALAGTTLPIAPSVRVVDANSNSVPGVAVTFAVNLGGGSITGGSATTDASGIATLGSWTLGGTPGPNSISVTLAGSPLVTATITATGTSTPVVAAIQPAGGDKQAVMAGGTLALAPSVVVTNNVGAVVAGVQVTFAVATGGGSITSAVATTDANGIARVGSWTLGATMGYNTLSATVAGSNVTGNPVTFGASACGGSGAGYKLTLCFTSPMTASQAAAFTVAASRWEGLITGELSNATMPALGAGQCGQNSFSLASGTVIDDLLIFASLEFIDGPGQVLGSAGACFIRQATSGSFAAGDLPVAGTMRFDVADIANLEANGGLNAVILHEMGHVIGIGSLWNAFGFLVNPVTQPGQTPAPDTYFTGVNALAGFDAIGGTTYTGGMKVPVENAPTSGAGTINSHWRETVLKNELMTGFLNNGANPLSVLTVNSLQDLGYTVNAAGADPFSLTLAISASRSASGSAATQQIRLIDDEYTGPVFTIDRRGRITRIR